MLRLDNTNTKGMIANYLTTYNNIECYTGDIQDYKNWYINFIKNIDNPKLAIAFDIEAKKVYCKGNFITHFSLCYKHNNKYYSYCFTIRNLDDKIKARIFNSLNNFKAKIVLHNAYYDIGQIKYLHNVEVKWNYDTYIIFHTLMSHRAKEDSEDFGDSEEDKGLSLKDFTRDYLPYGNYEKELEDEKKRLCKELGIKVDKFTYDLFSDEIIMPYCCFDTLCTLQAFEVGIKLFKDFENLGLNSLKNIIQLKKKTMDLYINSYCRGIEIDYNKVEELGKHFEETKIESKKDFINKFKAEIKTTELLHRLKEYESLMNESQIDFLSDIEQKGQKKGKTEKRENGKNYYKKGIILTDKQSEKLVETSTFSLTSSPKKTTLFIEVMGLKPLDKGKSIYEPIVLDEKDPIFSKCFGYKLNDDTGKRERKLLSPKTDINFISNNLQQYPSLQSLLDYGKCNTALNNFLGINKTEEDTKDIDGKTLAELTDKGKYPIVHPSYNILGTITNRCSCQRPNLQQIPARGVLSPLKECFKARDGYYFYYSDYASAEIVILTSIINSKRFGEALEKGWDLHSINVWFMLKDRVLEEAPEFQEMWNNCKTDDDFKKFYKEIKNRFESTLRYQCKSLTFSLAYGAGEHGVSKNLSISIQDAKDLIDRYMKANPEMKIYMDKQHKMAREKGYITNPFGAFLLTPDCPKEFSDKVDYTTKEKIERQKKKALNFPIQSSNAFLLYEGMLKAEQIIKEKGYEDKIHFMFSVYDSFCYEVSNEIPREEVKEILDKAFVCFLGDYLLDIDTEVGLDWKHTEKIENKKRDKNIVDNYDFINY